jgi:tetratricopeptide (TPR) repeat protein
VTVKNVKEGKAIALNETTPIPGIVYYTPLEGAVASGLDGKVVLTLGPEPVPLLEVDYQGLEGELPGYDAVGRGIYQALRTDPGCLHCERYAALLKEGYPHYVSELASHIIMLGEKDVEVPYLDRRVKLLRIFALMEPGDPHFPLEIGVTLLDKGCRFSALQLSTVTLFQAEAYLDRALQLAPAEPRAASTLAEVCFLLGKYEKAASLWRQLLPGQSPAGAAELNARLERIGKGELPRVPAVDYLEAVAGALSLKDEGAYEEAAAIFSDIMADAHFACEFPMPEIPYLLALCCIDMGGERDARIYLRQALRMNPDFAEAKIALEKLER